MIFVSVIIPVYNDCRRLRLCLEGLQNQSYSVNDYEVIVVDNVSTEDIRSIVEEFTCCQYATEKKKSSYAARNKGISLAKGKILAFTDSDCIPDIDWIEKGAAYFQNNQNLDIVGGEIEFIYYRQQPNLFELYDATSYLQQKTYVNDVRFAATANMFCRKESIDRIGLFNDELQSGGDLEWGKRAYREGCTMVYSYDACVKHPARKTFSGILKKDRRVIEGIFKIRALWSQTSRKLMLSIFLDALPPLFYIISLSKKHDIKAGYLLLLFFLKWILKWFHMIVKLKLVFLYWKQNKIQNMKR